MKRKVILFFVISVFLGCGKTGNDYYCTKDSGNVSIKSSDNSQVSTWVDEVVFPNVDMVVGNFSGKGMDTLYLEPLDSTTWRLFSPRGNIKPLDISGVYTVYIVTEGDLDKNGTDEIGVRREQEMGNRRDYDVFTYRNNGWCYLLPLIVIHTNHFYENLHFGQDAVMSDQNKEYVQVHFSRWIDEDMFLLDTIVKVNPVPVNMRNSIGFIH